jgi:hypothetical protein
MCPADVERNRAEAGSDVRASGELFNDDRTVLCVTFPYGAPPVGSLKRLPDALAAVGPKDDASAVIINVTELRDRTWARLGIRRFV